MTVSKPEWLGKMETGYERDKMLTGQSDELTACQRSILSNGAPKLWRRVQDRLYETIKDCRFATSTFDMTHVDHAVIKICPRNSAVLFAVLDVEFLLETFEIRVLTRTSPSEYIPPRFWFTVINGRVSISEGAEPLPDNGEDVAEVACQRILEPLLRLIIP